MYICYAMFCIIYMYMLPIDCLMIALNACLFSQNGYGPGTNDQVQQAAKPVAWGRMGPGSGELEFRAGGQLGEIFI